MKTHHFHSKLLCQKPMLRQIEWRLQNRPIIKSGVIASNCFYFSGKFVCFSKKELIWCTNDPNVHIRIFLKHWRLLLGCFFPVSIVKDSNFKLMTLIESEFFHKTMLVVIYAKILHQSFIPAIYKNFSFLLLI